MSHTEKNSLTSPPPQAAPPPTYRYNHLYARLPGVARRGFWWLLLRHPVVRKRVSGTVSLTAVGMFGAGGGWGAPLTGYRCRSRSADLRAPAFVGGRIETREYLGSRSPPTTTLFTAPGALLAQRCAGSEGGEGLEPQRPQTGDDR
jgi:hypothetical protein